MTGNSTGNQYSSFGLFVAYFPLGAIIFGTISNLIIFIIFCRSKFRDTIERPTLHYMRAIAIIDILMLYGWNLDHYLWGTRGYTLRLYSIPTCKIFSFLNYFACESSAWLRVFICLDRYLALSRLHRTWFSHSKNVLITIATILIVIMLFNLHIIIFGCYYDTDGSINLNSQLYLIYPLWAQINIFIYNYIPFVCMVTLNSLVIYKLIHRHRTSIIQNSRIRHRPISITLVITTFLFLIMTTPGNIGYGYFYDVTSEILLNFFDVFLYTYHSLSIIIYLITLEEFRQEFIQLIFCKAPARVQPLPTITRRTTVHPLATINKRGTIQSLNQE